MSAASPTPTIYPLTEPRQRWQLNVGAGHCLQVYEYGRADAPPVVVLHGGPGGGANALHASMFDPRAWRIICFDQRGCGQSTAAEVLQENTTQTLMADIEAIRMHLGIQQWHVSGGSWGSTLALVYAIEYPQRVLGMILRGVFLARQQDSDWLYGNAGVARLFPEFYREFTATLGADAGHSSSKPVIEKAWQGLQQPTSAHARQVAVAWGLWEARISTLTAKSGLLDHVQRDPNGMNAARIGTHFFHHRFFLPEGFILQHLSAISHIPAIIVHGRYDVVCSLSNAYELAARWPCAQLKIVQDAGHSSTEHGIARALVAAGHAFQQAR